MDADGFVNITKRLKKRGITIGERGDIFAFGVDISTRNTGLVCLGIWNDRIRCAWYDISYNKRFGKNSAYTKESVDRVRRANDIGQSLVHTMESMIYQRSMSDTTWCDKAAYIASIEGYSFGSRGRAIVHIGEFGGIVRHCIADFFDTVMEVPPKTWRKVVTGNGNSAKQAIRPIFNELVTCHDGVSIDTMDAFGVAMYTLVQNRYLEGYDVWRDKFIAGGSLVSKTKKGDGKSGKSRTTKKRKNK